jgi:hypothetical protein
MVTTDKQKDASFEYWYDWKGRLQYRASSNLTVWWVSSTMKRQMSSMHEILQRQIPLAPHTTLTEHPGAVMIQAKHQSSRDMTIVGSRWLWLMGSIAESPFERPHDHPWSHLRVGWPNGGGYSLTLSGCSLSLCHLSSIVALIGSADAILFWFSALCDGINCSIGSFNGPLSS